MIKVNTGSFFPGDNRGVAMLLAISLVSLLIGLTVQFADEMRQELVSSVNMKSSAQMNATMLSGYNIAQAVLRKDRLQGQTDSFLDIWGQLDNSRLGEVYQGGMLDIDIVDLGGRIPLNGLTGTMKDVLRRVLLSDDFGELEQEDVDIIVDAIIDWRDADDNSTGNFAETESGYYGSLDPSYESKNADFEYIEELLLLRGITPALYFGGDGIGLKDIVTPYGSGGKININTAPPVILRALMTGASEDVYTKWAEKMVAFRKNEENRDLLKTTGWYKSIPYWPAYLQLDNNLISVSSNFFSILSRVEISGMVKNMTSVVERKKDGEITLLSRKVE